MAAGAGVEYALDRHWSVFGEYLVYNFGSKSAFFQPTAAGNASDAKNRIDYAYSAQVARVGVNYSLDARGPGVTAAARNYAAAAADWAGFYVGANAGGGMADSQAMDADIFTGSDLNFHTGFAALGGQAGYNWQAGAAVLGVESDIDWTSASASRAFGLDNTPPFGPGAEHFRMDGFASLRARAGLALDRSLVYVTAGPAIGHFRENVVASDGSFTSPWTGWAPGPAAGAGFAYRLDPHWSVRAEFLHLAFADRVVNCVPGTAIAATDGCSVAHTQYANSAALARVGLDYSFDWGAIGKAPAPLTSKN
jgi:outer membrane immunogenic protein